MLEIEAKYPVPAFDAVERTLAAWGAAGPDRREDADLYFNAPDRDFRVTDEAFRVRRVGDAAFVTYKGPKIDAQTKTREEIEVPLAPGTADDVARLFDKLGYRRVAEVRKRRAVYTFSRDGFDMQACLDELPGVGKFVELEVVADEARFGAAKAAVLRAAADLGLEDQERRSYLAMSLAAAGRGGA